MRQMILGLVLVFVGLAPASWTAAQSYSDALESMNWFAQEVDRAHSESAPTSVSRLVRLRTGWQRLHHTELSCLKAVEVNGEPIRFRVIGPFERQDGLDFVIFSRGFAAIWNADEQATSLLLSQRFDARTGEPVGHRFLEGNYHSSPDVPQIGIVAADRWVDVPRASSSPPIHQPWGGALAALTRVLEKCSI